MNLPTIVTKNAHLLGRLVQNNSPAILTTVGAVGIVGTVVVTHRATVKATRILDNTKFQHNINVTATEEPIDSFGRVEALKLTWKCYVPVVGIAGLSVAAVIGAQYVNTRRMAVLAASYAVLESKHEEYRDKIEELFGKKKADQVDSSIFKDAANRATVGGVEIMAGDVPCIDALTNKPFSSNMEALRKAENDINARINHGDQPSVSDLYSLLEIPHTRLSDAFGWNDENMCEMKFTTVLDDSGTPYLVMDFSVLPVGSFWKIGK